MSAFLRSRQTPTHSVWSAHSQSNVSASSKGDPSIGSSSTKSTSQSEHRMKPWRYSTLHLGQNMKDVGSVYAKHCSSHDKPYRTMRPSLRRLPEPTFNTEGPYSCVLPKTRWVLVLDPRSCLLPVSGIS